MTLTLDVVSNVDYSKIEQEVNNIRDRLSKIPDKIKINIDVAMAKNAARAIEDIQSGIEGVVRSAGATSKMSGVTKGFDDAAKSATTMGSALRDQVDAITGVTRETHKGAATAAEWNELLRQQAVEAQNAAEANRLLAESEAEKQAAAQSTTTALQEQINAITGVTRETHNGATTASEWNMLLRMQAEEAKAAADQTKALEQAQRKAATAQKSSAAALSSGEKSLRNWTQAQHSSNEESRNAYANLQNAVNALRTARQNYDGSAASVANLEAATQNLNNVQKETEGILTRNGDASRTLGERFTELASKFTSWLTVSQAVMLAIRSIKKMASEAIAVDDAMTQLRIVTNETDATYQRFGENVAKTAQKIGASMTDIIDATTTFARLGYSLNESSALAELTTMLQKVGDIEARDAQSAITSIIKAFDIDVADMEFVMDKLVTVGNNFPISVSEIAEGMMNASSALAAAGNSFDKSVALLAAANTTIQDAAKASTGLRTITARLQKTDTELDELGEAMTESAYADLVGALTKHNVALQDANGEYRDTYDILQDIAAIWDTMSTTEQAALAELVAGNRQRNVFSSIISNFDVASGAMQEMQRSAGALKESYDEWLNSASAHIETFKAAFQGLATDFFSGDFVATFVDIGTAIINIIDGIVKLTNHVGGLKTVLMGVAGVVAVIKADAIVASITTLGTKLASFISVLGSVPAKLGTLHQVISKLSVALKALGVNASAAQIGMAGLVAAIGAIVAINSVIESVESAARANLESSFNEAMSGAESANIYELYKQYEAANAAIDGSTASKEALDTATRNLCAALGLEESAIEGVRDQLQQLTAEELSKVIDDANVAIVSAQKMLVGNMDTWRDSTEKTVIEMWACVSGIDISRSLPTAERAANLIKVYDILIAERKEMIDAGETDTTRYTYTDNAINLLAPDVRNLTAAQDTLATATERYNNVLNPTTEAVEDTATATEKAASNLKDASDNTLKAIENIEKAQKMLNSQEAGKSISLADFTAEGMEDYTSALEYVNGVYQLSAEKVNAIVQAKTAEQIAVNETNKAYAQQQYLENAKQIEKYRRELELAKDRCDGTEIAIQANIDSLIAENSALRSDCAQYDLMSAALAEATSAYQNWLNAKNAGQTGDMFDGALAAIKQMNDVLNNTDSDMYGRVGRTDYKAAVDFIVPDTIDHEDAAAVNAYMQSISDMFTFDDKGNQTGLNIGNFIQKSLDAGLIAVNEAGDAYEVAGGKTMEDFARGLGLSLPLVRAMFGELEEFGAKFDWADEAAKTFGDLAVAATDAADTLRDKLGTDYQLSIDVSDADKLKTVGDQCAYLDKTIEDMQRALRNRETIGLDASEVSAAEDIIRAAVAQKQILLEPDIMKVDTSLVEGKLGAAIETLQRFQDAANALEMAQSLGVDTTAAQAELDAATRAVQELDTNITSPKALNIDTASVDTILASLQNLDASLIVQAGVDDKAVIGYKPDNKTATVRYGVDRSAVDSFNPPNLTRYVTYKTRTEGSVSGDGEVNGSANASGSAHMRGDWRAKGGRSLVGELGREIIVDPNTGRWYTVGDNGAEFVNIPDGAIVFNHRQSDALLENGKVAGRGKAMASGSALVTGFIPIGIGNPGGGNNNGGYHNPSGGATNSVESNYDEELETFDWIEIAIDRIERIIEKFGKTAESVFKSLRTRVSATNDEIAMVSQEIGLQQRAYQKYMSAAEAVSLSSDLKQLVRNGAIDISQYDKDTQKLINDYKDLYEKALDCSASIDDLHEKLAQLYKDNFDNVQKDFENKLSLMEKQSDTYSRKIDKLEEQGYMQNANYYKQLRNTQQSNIGVLNQELVNLQAAFEAAMASGEIEEGSEAWYEMKFAIEDTKAAIEEAEIAIIKYDNTLRQIQWDYFDYAQERIGQITSEADFLLNLLDGKNMYDENGNLSETGIAAGGLHAEKYGIYMAQADKYAEEIKRINAEITNDPNNTKLIKRRDELVTSQRDAILAAKSEKEALVDLAREGINVELEAVKKLIDAYTESLDSAKDLYDYQKKIADKTKNIATLEKQIAAYQNDVSEETRSKIQKIQVQLADAKDDLKETEYERLISDSKKLLDNLYSEYEDVLNSRFDDIDATFEKMIDLTNDNFISINEYLSDIADGVGYVISDEGQSVWSMGGGVNGFVSEYGKDITTKLTATGIAVENIFGLLGAIAKQNGVDFPAAKSYAAGGLIDYTGIANVHGTAGNPEMVLNASDTKNFIMLRDALRNMGGIALSGSSRIGDFIAGSLGAPSITGGAGSANGYTVGAINVTIPIERVEDYNDFVNQLRNDRQFEKMVQDITIGRVAGKSKLSKNKYSW